MTHAELVARAERWLRNTKKCSVVLTEKGGNTAERPDAIGWRNGWWSTLVEAKTSRADFLADKKKPFRLNPESGMGQDRYFITRPGLLTPDELPEGWGLIEAHSNICRVVKKALSRPHSDERSSAEVPLLVSALWRAQNPGAVNGPVEPEAVAATSTTAASLGEAPL